MKKISILILLNLSVVFGYGQNETDLPKIIPPSPEAYILRQGNKSISINTYTGALNYSVPLFTINSGDIVFPISLNYIDGNGVRVEETASRIGLGWALNITGSISRTIRDQPDDSNGNDMNDGYLFHNFSLFHIDDAYIDPSIVNNIIDDYPNNWEQLWNIYKMPLYDTEPDLYTLSSPTLSSSKFHIKYNQNRVYTHEDIYKPILNNLKITPLISQNHINGFEVIDEIGNIYLFTDEEKIQTSGEDNRYKTTSWYLTEISNNKGDTIHFTYENVAFSNTTLTPISDEIISGNTTTNTFINRNFQAKRISSIIFNNGRIDINYNSDYREDYIINDHSVKSIELYDNQNKLVKGVSFNQSYFTPHKRLKLDSFNFYTYSFEESPYLFEYDDEYSLPNRFSHSRDHWGFYNGAPYNQSLEPRQIIISSTDDILDFGTGNRDANFNFGKTAILKKITYPTKGYTKFDFENHVAIALDGYTEIEDDSYSCSEFKLNPKFEFTIDNINISTEVVFSADTLMVGNNIYYPKFTSSGYVVNLKPLPGETFSSSKTVILRNGSYRFRLHYYDESGNILSENDWNHNPIINRNIHWVYVTNPDTVQIGGVRIKSIETFTRNGELSLKKKYEYFDGRMLTRPIYNRWYVFFYMTPPWNSNGDPRRTITSNSPLLTTQSSFIGYDKVIIKNLKNEQPIFKTEFNFSSIIAGNGYPESYWGDRMIHGSNIFPIVPEENNDYARGLLLSKKIYNLNNNLLIYQKTIDYNIVESHSIPDQSVFRSGLHGITLSHSIPSWFIDYYLNYGYIQKIREFEESFDLNGNNPVTKTIDFLYDDNNNLFLPKEITTSTSLTGNILKTQFTYPYEKTDEVSIVMTNANMISIPIEIKQYKNTTPLSYKKTEYHLDANNHILPERIKTTKSSDNDNDLETRIIYHNYDNKGNILDVSKANGIHTSYIWGYNKTQPIAKIENIKYTDIPQAELNALLNFNYTTGSEASLLGKLADLRNVLPNTAMATTMTYKPLIGISTVTNPKGDTQYYIYDGFNRLKFVKDTAGNILSENEYHYRE